MDLVQMKKDMDDKAAEEPKSISELASKIDEQVRSVSDEDKKKKIKVQRKIKFPIEYTDLDDEKTLRAILVSKIMDSGARLKYDQTLMALTAGFEYDNFPQTQKTRFQCLARIICQLEDAEPWILEKAGEDLDFCFAVASKLVEHENRYFRYYDTPNSDEAKKPRFSIDFPEFEEESAS